MLITKKQNSAQKTEIFTEVGIGHEKEGALLSTKIVLSDKIDVWDLNFYEKSDDPYIYTQNEFGSYITLNCANRYHLYQNAIDKSAIMPEYLIYIGRKEHFHLYEILLLKEELRQDWLKTGHIKMLDEIFSTTNFSLFIDELQSECLKIRQE